MHRLNTFETVAAAGILSIALMLSAGAGNLCGQDKTAATAKVESKSGEHRLTDQGLSNQETRGEGFFLQRCSICHLPRNLKFGSPPTLGPVLSGQFKSASPDELKMLRAYILKGGPGMPGFQYGLEAKDIDDLVAFLKTL
jgi:mono/diheme cytochrome c family protein